MAYTMKNHRWILVVAAVLTADVATAQLYLPVPPTTDESIWQLVLTNAAPRPTAFRRTIFAPGQPPSPQALSGLIALQTDIGAQPASGAHMEVVDVLKPGLNVSSRLVDSQGHSLRLPVFKVTDVVGRNKPMTFQTLLQPYEDATIVVFSPTKISVTCSVTLNNNVGGVSSFALSVPALSQIASRQFVAPATQVDFARVICSRPVLAFAYRGDPPNLEFIPPANSD
ncbi:MAG: hypothetical protein WAM82_26120 [Thermoanaerobaculia bacterium]